MLIFKIGVITSYGFKPLIKITETQTPKWKDDRDKEE
jgi:hypothetical protein